MCVCGSYEKPVRNAEIIGIVAKPYKYFDTMFESFGQFRCLNEVTPV